MRFFLFAQKYEIPKVHFSCALSFPLRHHYPNFSSCPILTDMHTPSDFQQKVFNTLAILGLSQVQILRDNNGVFTLETSSAWQRFLYVILRLNTLSKLVFLILLSCGFFQAGFEFFEKMAILLWFLIFILLAISERLFYRKYPFFELLTAWWKVEESVFIRLGSPQRFLKEVRWIGLWRVWFQGWVIKN